MFLSCTQLLAHTARPAGCQLGEQTGGCCWRSRTPGLCPCAGGGLVTQELPLPVMASVEGSRRGATGGWGAGGCGLSLWLLPPDVCGSGSFQPPSCSPSHCSLGPSEQRGNGLLAADGAYGVWPAGRRLLLAPSTPTHLPVQREDRGPPDLQAHGLALPGLQGQRDVSGFKEEGGEGPPWLSPRFGFLYPQKWV